MFLLFSSSSLANSCDSWLVDSGASRYFTGYKEVLSNLVEREIDLKIILGDNSSSPTKDSGTVSFHMDQGKTLIVQEVLYVPSLKKNLVSISTLEDKGMKIAFINGKVLTWPSRSNMSDALTLGSRCEDLCKIIGRPIHALIHDINLQSELWHRRYAHLHYKALPHVRKMVFGMPKIRSNHDGVCQGCASGKQVNGPYPSNKSRTCQVLHPVHSDLCGPMPITSLGGYLYYIIFVDDFLAKHGFIF